MCSLFVVFLRQSSQVFKYNEDIFYKGDDFKEVQLQPVLCHLTNTDCVQPHTADEGL
jgi:hypothetical protein